MYNRLIVFLLVTFIAVSNFSCTLHFKAKDVELDSESPKANIGQNTNSNTTFELRSLDLARRDH